MPIIYLCLCFDAARILCSTYTLANGDGDVLLQGVEKYYLKGWRSTNSRGGEVLIQGVEKY